MPEEFVMNVKVPWFLLVVAVFIAPRGSIVMAQSAIQAVEMRQKRRARYL